VIYNQFLQTNQIRKEHLYMEKCLYWNDNFGFESSSYAGTAKWV